MDSFCKKVKFCLFLILFWMSNLNAQSFDSSINGFVFSKNTEKVILKFRSGASSLKLNSDNYVVVTLENIDKNTTSFIGKNIRSIDSKNLNKSQMLLKILPTEENIKNDKFVLLMSYKSVEKFEIFEFHLPVDKY